MSKQKFKYWAGRFLSTIFDPSIIFSYDRTGYYIHSLYFKHEDIDIDMSGKICLITGANTGIGYATAEMLARRGAEVWLLCRNIERGNEAVESIRKKTGNPDVFTEKLDLTSIESIKGFAARFKRNIVDILIHNAGILPSERMETRDGIELTVATNLIGPFLLTHILLPHLLTAPSARLPWVSSGGMYTQRLRLEDFQIKKEKFNGTIQYAQTKRAIVILSEQFAEILGDSKIIVHSMHPGWVQTRMVRTWLPRLSKIFSFILRSPEEGADTVLWLSVCPGIEKLSGLFWLDRQSRWTYLLPFTRETIKDRNDLWELCCRLAEINEDEIQTILTQHNP